MCAVRRHAKDILKLRTFSELLLRNVMPDYPQRITTFRSSRRQYGTATYVNQFVKQTLSTQPE